MSKASKSISSASSKSGTSKIKVISDEKKLFSFAAEQVAKQLVALIKQKGFVTIAFAGGRSAATLCAKLTKQIVQKIDWSRVHIFMIDERLVPITDDESNFKIIHDTLVNTLNQKSQKLPRANVHPFVHDASQADGGASRYDDELHSVSDAGAFDIIFVSAGEDGHIAGLYPSHQLLKNKIDSFATFHDSPKPPADRMTSLPIMFKSAAFSLLLIIGEAKREALVKLKNKKLAVKDCPAKLVTQSKNHLILTNLKI